MRKRITLARLQESLPYHRGLLADARRNRAFFRALAHHVRPTTRVLDIGAGTGIWATAAAVLGARRVVAIEREPHLAPVIRALAQDNGVADRVEIVTGDSRRVRLAGRFDLLVTETVGMYAFDEDIVAIVADARRRFLRPGAALVPAVVRLRAAAVCGGALALPVGVPLRGPTIDELIGHFPVDPGAERFRPAGPPATMASADLRTVERRPPLRLASRLRVREGHRSDGVQVWVEMDLSPANSLSTRTSTSWSSGFFPLRIPRGCRDFRFELRLDRKRTVWGAHGPGWSDCRDAFFVFGSLASCYRHE